MSTPRFNAWKIILIFAASTKSSIKSKPWINKFHSMRVSVSVLDTGKYLVNATNKLPAPQHGSITRESSRNVFAIICAHSAESSSPVKKTPKSRRELMFSFNLKYSCGSSSLNIWLNESKSTSLIYDEYKFINCSLYLIKLIACFTMYWAEKTP